MISSIRRTAALAALALAASTALAVAPAFADSTVVVTGNTVDVSLGENGSPGWWFNRDASTSTPFEFSLANSSIGTGSIYVEPITNTVNGSKDKFIAENFVWMPVEELESISYDFLIAGPTGTVADADQFYLNIYANIDDSNNFYDCRFDYTPADPADLLDFSTATFDATDTPNRVVRRSSARIPTCPSTVAGMPGGSHIRAFTISVGDTSTSLSDTGLAGYLDNVVVDTTGGTTTYDFEAKPAAKADCANGGWMDFGFKNQGQCNRVLGSGKDSR